MQQTALKERIAQLTAPLAASLGLNVWGIELAFGPKSLLRIYVENECPEATGIEECAELSRLLGLSLDVEDCMPGAYVLEISSPGLERIYFSAEQLAGALGETIDLQLHAPIASFPGQRRFRGILKKAEEGLFVLEPEHKHPADMPSSILAFSFDQVKKVQRVHLFPEKIPPGKKHKG